MTSKYLFSLAAVLLTAVQAVAMPAFRPPAVPLVANDPYLSIWSESDRLTDSNTVHWTHHEHSLVSLIRIDGRTYRLMGDDPAAVPALPQTGLSVTPTRSIYQFQDGRVQVTLTFMTADLPHDLNVLSRPVSYITWSVRSIDHRLHAVSLYDSASSEIAVNSPDQTVAWKVNKFGPLTALQVGTVSQPLLSPPGDDTRIDWGYAYLAARSDEAKSAIGGDSELLAAYVATGRLPSTNDTRQSRAVSDDQPVLAFTFDLGQVGSVAATRTAMVAYDELYSIRLHGQKLLPYWRRNGATPSSMLQDACRDYPMLAGRCAAFDKALTADLTAEGGPRYAQMAAAALRESLAANGLAVDAHGQPLLFTKENTSNGDIATVDVIFPQAPMLVLLSPTLAKASLAPVFAYASSPVWKFPNAPHDLGTYPNASASGDAGEAMTVEESGNMLILADAICQEDGNANYVDAYWPLLSRWADYLQQYGPDPEDQICTDDFMGHLAHNANLSIKAIVALGAYGDMCRLRGDKAGYLKFDKEARADALHWVQVAESGGHSRLAFDQPDTWSQKYNLVWDKILGLNLFPSSVYRQETAFYKTKLLPYGLPLDSRTHVTKTDWTFWSATLTDNIGDFEALTDPAYDYADQTSARDPIADSYVTDDIHSGGMHARPVVGGFYIKMLADRAMWKKWSSGDIVRAAGWAPLPVAPGYRYLLPTSQMARQKWSYTTSANPPAASWYARDYDISGWKTGWAPFGHSLPATIPLGTDWSDTPGDIWLRRTVTLPPGEYSRAVFLVYHDEDVEIFVDGIRAAAEPGYNNEYEPLDINTDALKLLKAGATVTIAAHVRQTVGGQGFDLGIAIPN